MLLMDLTGQEKKKLKIQSIQYSEKINESPLWDQLDDLTRYLRLAAEFGCGNDGEALYKELERSMENTLRSFQSLVLSAKDPDEPDSLAEIRKLRPQGPRCLQKALPADYSNRLRGAVFGRMAGCTLGAALEFEPIASAKNWALSHGDSYPLTDYWNQVRYPQNVHYIVGKKQDLTKSGMNAVPLDDDTIYTLLGLLVMEEYGADFRQEQLAEIWKKYLPLGKEKPDGEKGCWWGERTMLRNLLAGQSLPEAGINGNPNLQSIAAWARADSYGYVFPGNPERAAELAYRDAAMNHR